MNPFHFILPKSRLRDFFENPFDYLLRASGMKINIPNRTNTILNLPEDINDDAPILPLINDDDEDDDEFILSSPDLPKPYKDNRSVSFIAEQEAIQAADADIPDADQLGIQFFLIIFKINRFLFPSFS